MNENIIIASIFNNQACCKYALTTLESRYFENSDHRKIFEAVKEIGEALTLSLFNEHTNYRFSMYVSQQIINSTGYDSFKIHVAKLKKEYKARELNKISFNANVGNVDQAIDETIKKLRDLNAETDSDIKISSFSERREQYIKKLLDTTSDKGLNRCNIANLDSLFKGFKEGLYIIAGRSHMGKTTFAQYLAKGLCESSSRVLFCSLEDGEEQVDNAFMSICLGVDSYELQTKYRRDDILNEVADYFEAMSIDFIHSRVSAKWLHSYLEQNDGKYDAVFIDQISYVLHEKSGDGNRVDINNSIRDIKTISKELHLPVFLLSQINRGVEQRDNKRPLLSDLKDTGSLEEDADVVMLLYRDDYYNPNNPTSKGIIEVNIAKNKITHKNTVLCLRRDGNTLRSDI